MAKIDGLVKSRNFTHLVIPAKAGIQSRRGGINSLQKHRSPAVAGVATFYESGKNQMANKFYLK
jgi:hypothetical protein